ncbi:MAG: DUF378 domain-containing protein [Patescibacteria group bacterium]
MKILHCITFSLLLVGALNWGLFALTGWDVSVWLGGMTSQWAKILYLAVGAAAVLEIATHPKNCKVCGKNPGGMM